MKIQNQDEQELFDKLEECHKSFVQKEQKEKQETEDMKKGFYIFVKYVAIATVLYFIVKTVLEKLTW